MSVVAKSTCRGGSNVGDTVSFVMKKKTTQERFVLLVRFSNLK